jgi:hypothetical protein
MEIGSGYPVTVTNGNAYVNDQCGVWVDWNQDGDFSDAGETVAMGGGASVFSGMVVPPVGAVLGDTRMRIRIMYIATLSPCGTVPWGEVEDYTITVVVGETGRPGPLPFRSSSPH